MSVPEDAASNQPEGASAASEGSEDAPEGTPNKPPEGDAEDPVTSTHAPEGADLPAEFSDAEQHYVNDLEEIEEYDTSPPGAIVVTCPNCASAIPLTSELDVFAPKPSTRYATCDECEGFGQVATGSHIAEHAVIGCPACSGQGYLTTSGEIPAPPVTPIAPVGEHGNPPWPNAQWDTARGMWI